MGLQFLRLKNEFLVRTNLDNTRFVSNSLVFCIFFSEKEEIVRGVLKPIDCVYNGGYTIAINGEI